MSFFLGEEDPGERARGLYRNGEFRACLEECKTAPENEELGLLAALAGMGLAEQAIREGRLPYARELLDRTWAAGQGRLYFDEAQRRRWKLLYARAGGSPELGGEDEVLLLRARMALDNDEPERACHLLEAMEQRDAGWQYLRGEVHFKNREFAQAARCYHGAEGDYPVEGRLEICYRELEDYKMAYYYAKKQEEKP